MGMLYLGGDGANLWGRGTEINLYTDEDTRLTASPAMDAGFPVASVHDGFPSQPAIWASDGATSYIELYLQQLKNGELDDWTGATPDEWSKGEIGGAVVEDAAIKVAGSSAKVSTAAGAGTYAYIRQDIAARPGEAWQILGYLRGDGGAGADAAQLFVLNANTGHYLQPDGSWSASVTPCLSRNVAAFTDLDLSFTVESFAACNYEQWVELVLYCQVAVSIGVQRDSWYDRMRMAPLVNFASIHGHNIGGAECSVQLRGSKDFFVADDNLIATLTNASPTMWVKHATMQEYWSYRLQINGAQLSTLLGNKYLGEVVLGQATEAVKAPRIGYETIHHDAQMRSPDALGEQRVYRRGPSRRRLNMRFFGGDTAYDEALHEFVHRASLGSYPMVVIPDSGKADGAVYGRLNRERTDTRVVDVSHRWGMVVDEMPFGPVIP